jgi:hypothetical protein
MTKDEFFLKLPTQISHACLGPGNLIAVVDLADEKAACYSHGNHQASFKTYGLTWQAVYTDMLWILRNRSHFIEKS